MGDGEMWERGICGREWSTERKEKYGRKMDFLIHGVDLTGLYIWKKIKLDLIYCTNKFQIG